MNFMNKQKEQYKKRIAMAGEKEQEKGKAKKEKEESESAVKHMLRGLLTSFVIAITVYSLGFSPTMGRIYTRIYNQIVTPKTAQTESPRQLRRAIVANWGNGEVQLESKVWLYKEKEALGKGKRTLMESDVWVDYAEVKPGAELFMKIRLTNNSSTTIKNPNIKVSLPDKKYGLEYVSDYSKAIYDYSSKDGVVGLSDGIVRNGSTSRDIQSHHSVYIVYKLRVTKAPVSLYNTMKPEIVIWNKDGMVIADNSVTIHLVDPKGNKDDHRRSAVVANGAEATNGPGTGNDDGGYGGSVIDTTDDQGHTNSDRGLKQASASTQQAPPIENGVINLPYGATPNQ
jgi:hypothetical protein